MSEPTLPKPIEMLNPAFSTSLAAGVPCYFRVGKGIHMHLEIHLWGASRGGFSKALRGSNE